MVHTTMAMAQATAERRFYTGMAIAILVVVFVGFAQTFFLRPFFPDTPAPPERIFVLHGLLFSAWIALLIVQATLVRAGRTALHRRIGPWGGVLAAAMVVIGTWSALIAAARPQGFIGIPVPPLQFLAVPLADIVSFALLVAIGIARRRDPQSHKRLIMLATITLLAAAIARWPVLSAFGPPAYFGCTDLFIVALGVWDFRSRGKLHPVTLWGGLLVIASQPLRLAIMGTDAWLAFAKWATGLVA